MKFSRTKNVEKLLESLQKEELYLKALKQDIQDKNVFMGLRDNSIDFYYGGSKIYSYKNKFFSHKKFCINAETKDEYINQDTLNTINIITCPIQNYKLIKDNAKKYGGIEDKGISYLFNQDYFSKKDIFLLDIEIAFYDTESRDRVDILLYDNKNQILKFIEAKDYTNKELWAEKNAQPKVVEQIKRYNDRLLDSDYYTNILNEYKKYITILNNFFEVEINEPKEIIKNTSLYVFGFDENQKIKINKLLKDDNSLENINYYFNGDPKKTNVEILFNKS